MMLVPLLLLSTYTISCVTAAIGPLIDPLSDSQFSTNSMHEHDVCEPWDAKYTVSDSRDGWCAANTNFGAPNGPYLEINFGRKTNIHAIATKGRGCCTQYVTSYIFSYYDGNTWIQYDSGFVFVGNNNNYQEEVRHELIDYNGVITAVEKIRFYPITYVGHAAMRVEAYGNDWTASPTELPSKPPSLNPTLQPIQPTSQPTVSPNNIPTIDPTYDPSLSPTQVTLPPTNKPTLTPTNDPTSDPTKHPTSNPSNPTDDPTFGPSNNPTSSPTNPPTFSSLDPTKNPTFNPTLTPSENPTVSTSNPTLRPSTHPSDPTASPTTNMPTVSPTEVDVEVRDETMITRNGAGVNDKSPTQSTNNLSSGLYILAVCPAVLCCLTIALIGIVWKRRKDKQKIAREDRYRQEMYFQSNMKESMDVWTNPVHHQTNVINHVGTDNTNLLHLTENDGIIMDTNCTNSSEIEMNNMSQNAYGFNESDIGNNDEEVLDDIMETPMGDHDDDDDDDIDDINNDIDDVNYNYNNDDDDVLVDNIDDIMETPMGDHGDDDIYGIDNINDDVDEINNDIENEELVNDIDNMITKGDDNYTAEGGGTDDDDDVIDDNLAHVMETPGGDYGIIIDDINMNEEDADIFENEDFYATMQ